MCQKDFFQQPWYSFTTSVIHLIKLGHLTSVALGISAKYSLWYLVRSEVSIQDISCPFTPAFCSCWPLRHQQILSKPRSKHPRRLYTTTSQMPFFQNISQLYFSDNLKILTKKSKSSSCRTFCVGQIRNYKTIVHVIIFHRVGEKWD